MSKPQCLIVDDEPDILELIARTIEPMGIDCHKAETVEQALKCLQSNSFDLCLTDIKLPQYHEGIGLVTHIVQNYPQTPVAMVTSNTEVDTAVQALKAGAFDYVTKPVKLLELRNLVNSALQLPKLNKSTITNSLQDSREELFSGLVGKSVSMRELRAKIEKIARVQAPIHIHGESGTGKEVVAKLIHRLGTRANKPYVAVNCGAIPNDLMESEFFGYKKGAFTGAITDKDGLFREAQGGTLFLDEISDLPILLQSKLLRAIQEKQIRPIGTIKEIPIDVRILSATHSDLTELVKQGKFREDLFFRINVIELYIPPLRERMEDLHDLIDKILTDVSKKNGCPFPRLAAKAISALENYSFPGNIRELENILERATTLCNNDRIEINDLHININHAELISENQSVAPVNDIPITNGNTQAFGENQTFPPPLEPLLEDIERNAIQNAMEKADWNLRQAARILGIGVGALRHRLRKYPEIKSGKKNGKE